MLAEVCSHKMGATQVYGSSYTLSSDIIPTIEAQPVPKLRLSKIDKLGRSLMHSQHFSIDVFVSTKNRKKNIGGVYQSRDFYAFVNMPLFHVQFYEKIETMTFEKVRAQGLLVMLSRACCTLFRKLCFVNFLRLKRRLQGEM